ncbi:glycosyltransferase family 2 protein [Paraburkholderia sp. J11-2]|uniref:glycosyltransferase family 2 protein n=1 Tax=Paraburkholderia sp. J11-2 TaxID=2805431 RepID=UPI002AB69D11|nr:glycosyltransferase family 2 protein [Paraburkholderia sp. J11-2]
MPVGVEARHVAAALEPPLISIVAPFYNEQDSVGAFFAQIVATMESIESIRFEIVCVNDGSSDATLERLIFASQREQRIKVIDLSRNFGKEAALTAGLDEAAGDAVIVIDADLQDPPSLIPEMIQGWRDGAEVVLARRASRACDSFLKRTTAALFYRIHNALSELKIPENVGDFRLMDRQVVNALRDLPERHRFMKGLFAWVGFNTVMIDYERTPRCAGKTKFSGWRLWNFALEGITSFSTVPLRSWTYIGGALAAFALCYGIFMVGRTLMFGNPVPGYASLFSVVLFLSGVQLVGIGVVGEYIGRIYDESKKRPVYLVRRRYESRGTISVLPVERADTRTHSAPLELVRWRGASQVRAAGR